MTTGRRILALLLMTAPVFVGCDEKTYDYDPAEGMGTLVVDNRTGQGDVDVYVDGRKVVRVDDLDHDGVDVEPGLHRVVLTGRDDNRASGLDVDVLEGRLTILLVTVEQGSGWRYEVDVDYD